MKARNVIMQSVISEAKSMKAAAAKNGGNGKRKWRKRKAQ
jgi:hypothetical protein